MKNDDEQRDEHVARFRRRMQDAKPKRFEFAPAERERFLRELEETKAELKLALKDTNRMIMAISTTEEIEQRRRSGA